MPEETRSTPLSHAFCRHVVANNEPLVIADARQDDELKHMPSIEENGFVGYLGFPLHISNGMPLGSFCVIDKQPHDWTAAEIEIMRELAQIVAAEIDLRAHVYAGHLSAADLDLAHKQIEAFAAGINTNASQEVILEQVRAGRKQLHLSL